MSALCRQWAHCTRATLSLVRRALRENQTAVASIYVNPTQFGPNEDFNKYPRTEDSDVALLESVGAHAAFIPSGSLYDADNVVRVVWRDIAQTLREAAARPGHFDGVMTVCAKLFNLVQPTRVYVGAKDAAQCIVLARMVRELDFPFELVVCDTLRESDGLAMSSRNRYLSSDDRQSLHCDLSCAQRRAAARRAAAGNDHCRPNRRYCTFHTCTGASNADRIRFAGRSEHWRRAGRSCHQSERCETNSAQFCRTNWHH
jgi:pantoate--beta-alanine ligase